jgi:CBS domain-containing protein
LGDLTQGDLPIRSRVTVTEDGKLFSALSVWCPGRHKSLSVDDCAECEQCDAIVVDQEGGESYVACRRYSTPPVLGDSPPQPQGEVARIADRTPVASIMSRSVICVTPAMSARALADLLRERAISGAPVVDESGAPVGVVSRTDLLERGEAAPTVGQLMSDLPVTIAETESVAKAAALMTLERVHRLPVVTADARRRVVGILSAIDVLAWIAREGGYLQD